VTTQLPRPALLAIVGVIAVIGLFFVTRRGGEEPVPDSPAPSQTAQPTDPSASTPEAPAQKNATQDKTAATGEAKGARKLFVVYMPYATTATTGIPTTAKQGEPWLMFPGTPKAHIMLIGSM